MGMVGVRFLSLMFTITAAAQTPVPEIRWSFGPAVLAPAGRADLPVPAGLIYVQGTELGRFLTASGNPPSGRELAVVGARDLGWFAVVSREDRIGVEELHRAIVNGTEAANLVRARQGRETLDVLGYREAPQFDKERQVLTWSLDTVESGGRAVVNRFAYFVGRRTVIGFEMVTEAGSYEAARAAFDGWLRGFRFRTGEEAGRGVDWGLWTVLGIAGAAGWLIWRRRSLDG